MATEKALKTIQMNSYETLTTYKNCIKISGLLGIYTDNSDEKMTELLDSITEIFDRAELTKPQKQLFLDAIKKWVPTCDAWYTNHLNEGIFYTATLFLENDLALTLNMQEEASYIDDIDSRNESLLFEYLDGEVPYIEVS